MLQQKAHSPGQLAGISPGAQSEIDHLDKPGAVTGDAADKLNLDAWQQAYNEAQQAWQRLQEKRRSGAFFTAEAWQQAINDAQAGLGFEAGLIFHQLSNGVNDALIPGASSGAITLTGANSGSMSAAAGTSSGALVIADKDWQSEWAALQENKPVLTDLIRRVLQDTSYTRRPSNILILSEVLEQLGETVDLETLAWQLRFKWLQFHYKSELGGQAQWAAKAEPVIQQLAELPLNSNQMNKLTDWIWGDFYSDSPTIKNIRNRNFRIVSPSGEQFVPQKAEFRRLLEAGLRNAEQNGIGNLLPYSKLQQASLRLQEEYDIHLTASLRDFLGALLLTQFNSSLANSLTNTKHKVGTTSKLIQAFNRSRVAGKPVINNIYDLQQLAHARFKNLRGVSTYSEAERKVIEVELMFGVEQLSRRQRRAIATYLQHKFNITDAAQGFYPVNEPDPVRAEALRKTNRSNFESIIYGEILSKFRIPGDDDQLRAPKPAEFRAILKAKPWEVPSLKYIAMQQQVGLDPTALIALKAFYFSHGDAVLVERELDELEYSDLMDKILERFGLDTEEKLIQLLDNGMLKPKLHLLAIQHKTGLTHAEMNALLVFYRAGNEVNAETAALVESARQLFNVPKEDFQQFIINALEK